MLDSSQISPPAPLSQEDDASIRLDHTRFDRIWQLSPISMAVARSLDRVHNVA